MEDLKRLIEAYLEDKQDIDVIWDAVLEQIKKEKLELMNKIEGLIDRWSIGEFKNMRSSIEFKPYYEDDDITIR